MEGKKIGLVRKILEYVRGQKLECVRGKNGICRKKLECAMKKWNKSPKISNHQQNQTHPKKITQSSKSQSKKKQPNI